MELGYIKAPDSDIFKIALASTYQTGRGIIPNDIGYRSGLLILNEFGGVTADTERCVKDVFITEQTDTAAARDLATGVCFGFWPVTVISSIEVAATVKRGSISDSSALDSGLVLAVASAISGVLLGLVTVELKVWSMAGKSCVLVFSANFPGGGGGGGGGG